MINRCDNQIVILGCTTTGICDPLRPARCNGAIVGVSTPTSYPIYPTRHLLRFGAIPNLATEKEPKRNFLYFTDVTLVVVDIKSERFIKRTCLQQDLFDMTMVTIMFDTKSSESESFKCQGVYDSGGRYPN